MAQRKKITLHEEMARIIKARGRPMSAHELLAAIIKANRYKTRSGEPVSIEQVHARVSNYPQLFSRSGIALNRHAA